MMFPYWYKKQKKLGLLIMGIGLIVMLGTIWMGVRIFYRLYLIGLIIISFGPFLQHYSFKKLEKLQDDPMRCECGGHFVPPWDLGFEGPSDVLICDNENGLGPGIACENWIVIPPDHPLLQNIGES